MKYISCLPVRSLLTLLLVFCLAAPAFAHKVQVFAYVSGDEIFSEVSLAANQPAAHCEVIVSSSREGEILQGETDTQGWFTFPKPDLAPGENLVITANVGQGHRGAWTLTPDDFGQVSSEKKQQSVHRASESRPGATSLTSEDQEYLATLVAGAVAREVEPLKRMLAREMGNEPTLQNVMGGVGWLVGIGGLLFALKKKHHD